MPVPLSDNAVCSYINHSNSNSLDIDAYSFGGRDSTLTWSGASRMAFCFKINASAPVGEWQILPLIPDTIGKVGMAASTIKDKIYVIGGAYLLPDGRKVSSNRVHVFDPINNLWLEDAAPIPIPVHDHAQIVYDSSLIYVVSGMQDSVLTNAVQVFNPELNVWRAGTFLPNNAQFKAFGASGAIGPGDDMMVISGGAGQGPDYAIAPYVRTGSISASDPTSISWNVYPDPLAAYFKGVSDSHFRTDLDSHTGDLQPNWFLTRMMGGSSKAHNLQGLALDSSGPVEVFNLDINACFLYPSGTVCWENYGIDHYNTPADEFFVTDLRGVAIDVKTDPYLGLNDYPGRYVIIGGMGPDRKPTGKVLSVYHQYFGLDAPAVGGLEVYPTLTSGSVQVQIKAPNASGDWDYSLANIDGKTIRAGSLSPPAALDFNDCPNGMYFLTLQKDNKRVGTKIMIAR